VPLLHDVIALQSDRRPNHRAVVEGDRVLTYEALWNESRRVAVWLRRHLAPGARVGLLLGNTAHAVSSLYGVVASGCIAVPIDADIHRRNLAAILDDCGVDLVITSARLMARVAAASERPAVRFVSPDVFPAEDAGAFVAPHDLSEHNLACVLYTTGTTGPRKGVMLSHANLLAATANMNAFMLPGPWIVESVPMRLSHSFGFARIRAIFDAGGTAVLEEGLSRVDRLIGNISRHGVNAISSVPAGFGLLLDNYLEPFAAVAKQIRLIEIGSAPMAARHRELIAEACPNARICMHYGLTEASRAAFLDFHTDRSFLHTAGRPAPNVQIRIALENGDEARAGVTGEVEVKGDVVAIGYWGRHDETRTAFVDGWLHTGDLGAVDAHGYLHLAGRREDILNLGGMKVAAAEIEERLRAADGIADAAVALNSRSDALGPSLTAFIVLPDPTVSLHDFRELRAHCLRELESYKVPRNFMVVEALPRTASGKLQRHLLDRLQPARTWNSSPTKSAPSLPPN
jgi:long-chain acyl-CoA synthetase